MPKATTSNGDLVDIVDCYIKIPGSAGLRSNGTTITMKVMPDISDTKKASYQDENVIGRSQPIKTYSHSDNRSISWTIHFIARTRQDLTTNMNQLRMLESLVYPRDVAGGAPYRPPPLVKLKCGSLLSRTDELCAVLESYSVKFDTSIPFDATGYIPYKFDVDLSFQVVYQSDDLPGQERILRDGK